MAIALETGEIDAHTFKLKAETERLGTLFLLEDYPHYDIMATASLGLSVGAWELTGNASTDKGNLRKYLMKKFDYTEAEANSVINLVLDNTRLSDVAPEKKLFKFFDVNRDNIFSAADSRLMLRQKELF
jgi:hypothetical protein